MDKKMTSSQIEWCIGKCPSFCTKLAHNTFKYSTVIQMFGTLKFFPLLCLKLCSGGFNLKTCLSQCLSQSEAFLHMFLGDFLKLGAFVTPHFCCINIGRTLIIGLWNQTQTFSEEKSIESLEHVFCCYNLFLTGQDADDYD